jgi:hypothetical protein
MNWHDIWYGRYQQERLLLYYISEQIISGLTDKTHDTYYVDM